MFDFIVDSTIQPIWFPLHKGKIKGFYTMNGSNVLITVERKEVNDLLLTFNALIQHYVTCIKCVSINVTI